MAVMRPAYLRRPFVQCRNEAKIFYAAVGNTVEGGMVMDVIQFGPHKAAGVADASIHSFGNA